MKWFKHIQGCLTKNLISIIIPLPVTLHIRCQCLAKVLEQASGKLISAQGHEPEEGGCRVSLTYPFAHTMPPPPTCLACSLCFSVAPSLPALRLSSRKAALKPQQALPGVLLWQMSIFSPSAGTNLPSCPEHWRASGGLILGSLTCPAGCREPSGEEGAQTYFLSLPCSIGWPGGVISPPKVSIFTAVKWE